jgi:hypothetical protein
MWWVTPRARRASGAARSRGAQSTARTWHVWLPPAAGSCDGAQDSMPAVRLDVAGVASLSASALAPASFIRRRSVSISGRRAGGAVSVRELTMPEVRAAVRRWQAQQSP